MHKQFGAVARQPTARLWLAVAAVGLAIAFAGERRATAQEIIKVGVLHSLSGTMAISETTLKDVMLMLIEEQNKKGGLLARSSKRLWSTLPRTGRSSPRRRVN